MSKTTDIIPEIYSAYNVIDDTDRLTRSIRYKGHFVPRNFITDYTTSPLLLRWLVPRYGKGNLAAVIHDLYYTSRLVSRAEADKYYHEILVDCGVPKWNASLRWAGVRVVGWYYRASEESAANFRKTFKLNDDKKDITCED